MCKSAGESVQPFACLVAHELWSMVFVLFGVSWVMPSSVLELLACWQGRFGRHCSSEFWNAIPHCLMWCPGVRGMLELLKAVRESSKILTCPSSLYLSGYRLLVYFFLLLIWLRCLIVVLCVLNVGVLCVHILCTCVAFLCYF